MYDALPENHKFLFDYIYEKENTNGIWNYNIWKRRCRKDT
jgi:hypothetical protein